MRSIIFVLYTKYCWCDKTKKVRVGGLVVCMEYARSMYIILVGKPKRKRLSEIINLDTILYVVNSDIPV
jgi:hypothetical protein